MTLLACIALVCATTVYVARLLFADRADARVKRDAESSETLLRLTERVETLSKTVGEHKAVLSAAQQRGTRR